MSIQKEVKKISTICPICKSKKSLEIPNSILNKNSQLTTISLPKGLICNHHFQMFVDKNFKVRGYQKVDFELEKEEQEKNKSKIKNKKLLNPSHSDDKELFENLLKDGNYLQFQPSKLKSTFDKSFKIYEGFQKKHLISLKDIYEEFWEFIDDDNPEFENFIIKDKRRITLR